MYEIKVTVANTVPSFMDRLNSLDIEGEKTNALIDINEALRIEVNKHKYEAIIDTLKPIMDGYKRLYDIANKYDVPLTVGLQSRLGSNILGVERVVNLYVEYGTVKICYYDGNSSHSIYPFNDEKSNYSINGIITNWDKHHIIEDFEKRLDWLIGLTQEKIEKKKKESTKALNSAMGIF